MDNGKTRGGGYEIAHAEHGRDGHLLQLARVRFQHPAARCRPVLRPVAVNVGRRIER